MAGKMKDRVVGFHNLMALAPCQVGKAFADNAKALAAKKDPAKVAGEVDKAWEQLQEQIAQAAREDMSPGDAAQLRRDLGLPIW